MKLSYSELKKYSDFAWTLHKLGIQLELAHVRPLYSEVGAHNKYKVFMPDW